MGDIENNKSFFSLIVIDRTITLLNLISTKSDEVSEGLNDLKPFIAELADFAQSYFKQIHADALGYVE